MATIDEMAAKGRRKLEAKARIISERWEAAKPDMIAGYRATPFGPSVKAAYEAAISVAKHRLDIPKWERRWKLKVSK